eukprot:scaffold114547_cov27-Prasinocladus_malaysianus.AAC.2
MAVLAPPGRGRAGGGLLFPVGRGPVPQPGPVSAPVQSLAVVPRDLRQAGRGVCPDAPGPRPLHSPPPLDAPAAMGLRSGHVEGALLVRRSQP